MMLTQGLARVKFKLLHQWLREAMFTLWMETLLLIRHRVHQLRQGFYVSLRYQQSLYLAHFLKDQS